jgi:hypothetical protein
MGNGAVGNGGKIKQFFKDVGTGIKDGIGTVLKFGQDILKIPGVTDAINMGARAFGVPINVGDLISSDVDISSNLLGGGSQKRDILKDLNKYDFKTSIDQFSSLIKWKK